MNQKTKDKIEAMANKWEMKFQYKAGATPWVEWCERFEKELSQYLEQYERPNFMCPELSALVKEYQQWLEER